MSYIAAASAKNETHDAHGEQHRSHLKRLRCDVDESPCAFEILVLLKRIQAGSSRKEARPGIILISVPWYNHNVVLRNKAVGRGLFARARQALSVWARQGQRHCKKTRDIE